MSQSDWSAVQALVFSQKHLIDHLIEELRQKEAKEVKNSQANDALFRLLDQRDDVFYRCKGCKAWFLENHQVKGYPEVDCHACTAKQDQDHWATHNYCEKCYYIEFCHYHQVCQKHFKTCCKAHCEASYSQ